MKEAFSRIYESVDDLLAAFISRTAADGKPVHCVKSCSWCCHQAVFAASHEFYYLIDFMQEQLSEEQVELIGTRARDKSSYTLSLPIGEQTKLKKECPFLEAGTCTVYEARPMACRIYLSYDADSCEKEYRDPMNEEYIPALFEFPLRAGRMLNEGFVKFLRERGFQVSELPLEQGYASLVTLQQTMET